MASVYVVRGETGEYSDRRDWDVKAFHDETAAKALRDRLNQWCREKGVAEEHVGCRRRDSVGKPPEDPKFDCDYTGTTYEVFPIDLA